MLSVIPASSGSVHRGRVASETPSVFVVDDDGSVRTAIARLMRSIGVDVSLFASAEDFLDSYDESRPGCLVLDLDMPGMDGLAVQQALAARESALPVVFLTGHGSVPASVLAMKRGAVDFLVKPVDDTQLIAAVRAAVAQDFASRSAQADVRATQERVASLTPRERQVFRLMLCGKANKVIAIELGTVEKTVKVHRARVMRKMLASSLAGMVQSAARAGEC